jgi:hypothetical protein
MRKLQIILVATAMVFVGMISCGGQDACAAPGSGTGGYRPPPVRVTPPRAYTPAPRPSAPRTVAPTPRVTSPSYRPSLPPVVVVPAPYNERRC